MTTEQMKIIDAMGEDALRKTISWNIHDREIVVYCELKLEHLNTDLAMVEQTDLSDFNE